jgi:DNA-binding MarR family transcriptional regulator
MKNNDLRTPSGVAVSELIVTVFRLNGRLLASGDRLVAEFGLTSARWQVLGAIAFSPVPEPVARLARNMGLNRQGVQRIIGELVADGFVELKDNPHHRSAKLIVMTAKGLQAYDAAMRVQAGWWGYGGGLSGPRPIAPTNSRKRGDRSAPQRGTSVYKMSCENCAGVSSLRSLSW